MAAGLAVVVGLYQGLGRLFISDRSRAIMGVWYGYAFFQNQDGPVFYREVNTIRRSAPWRLSLSAKPIGSEEVTHYQGTVRFNPPYVYINTFEPVYADRCSELYRWQQSDRHDASMLVGIHLGRTYEEAIHNATPMIMARRQLDPKASVNQMADVEVERAEFLRIVQRHFKLDDSTFQLLFQ